MTNNGTTSRNHLHRVLLWIALAVSVTCNAVTSIMGLGMVVSVPFGVLALVCGLGLVAHYRKR